MSVVIRLANERDAEGVREIYGPVVRETAISFEDQVPALDDLRERIRRVNAIGHWIIAEESSHGTQQCLGYAYASTFRERAAYRWTAESAVYVHHDHQRRGVARALYTALIEGLRHQGFETLIAGATLPNPASVALHESFGFRPVGTFHRAGYKFGAWHDVGFWERPVNAAPAERPGEISSATTIAQNPAWVEACSQAAESVRER